MAGGCLLLARRPPNRLLQYCVAALLWLPTLSAGLNIMSYTFAGQITARIC